MQAHTCKLGLGDAVSTLLTRGIDPRPVSLPACHLPCFACLPAWRSLPPPSPSPPAPATSTTTTLPLPPCPSAACAAGPVYYPRLLRLFVLFRRAKANVRAIEKLPPPLHPRLPPLSSRSTSTSPRPVVRRSYDAHCEICLSVVKGGRRLFRKDMLEVFFCRMRSLSPFVPPPRFCFKSIQLGQFELRCYRRKSERDILYIRYIICYIIDYFRTLFYSQAFLLICI